MGIVSVLWNAIFLSLGSFKVYLLIQELSLATRGDKGGDDSEINPILFDFAVLTMGMSAGAFSLVGASKTNQPSSDEDHASKDDRSESSESSRAGRGSSLFVIFSHLVFLIMGASAGYVASNTLLVSHFAEVSDGLQKRHDESLAVASAMRRKAEEDADKCRAESDDKVSELTGKLEARSLIANKHEASVTELQNTKDELGKVRAQLDMANTKKRELKDKEANARKQLTEAKKALHETKTRMGREVSDLQSQVSQAQASTQEVSELQSRVAALDEEIRQKEESHEKLTVALKNEMVTLGEKLGRRIGDLENQLFDSQEERRRQTKDLESSQREARDVRGELEKSQRSRQSLENKLRKEQENQAGMMDEYTNTAMELKQVRSELEAAKARCGGGDEVKAEL